jgi:SAM-dependent methyltransferase
MPMGADSQLTWEQAVLWLRARPDSAEFVRACFYDDPLTEAADRYWRSSEWTAVRSFLPAKVGRALDIGSGRGISAHALARDGWQVTALEPDSSDVVGAGAIRRLAHDTDLAIEVTQTWGEDLPFAAASFDLVHCRQVLHHARDLNQLCRQIGRVLRPGGLFVATREHVISRKEDLRAFLASHPLHRFYGGENAYLLNDYKAAIERAGIRIDHTLNPMQSDINLFPDTTSDVKMRWAKRLGLPSGRLVPDAVLSVVGSRSKVPGRLYSFIGTRAGHG